MARLSKNGSFAGSLVRMEPMEKSAMSTSYSHALELRNGDCMKQPEFHALYERMPESFRAELIDGTVFVSMPVSLPHSRANVLLSSLLAAYSADSANMEALCHCTVILGVEDEVQPDVVLRLSPTADGSTSDDYDDYINGAPELVCEIAYSSRAIDLHLKRKRYEKAGVTEYLVWCLQPKEIHWFSFVDRNLIEPNEDDVLCSRIFPGLWVDREGLLSLDYHKVMATLNSGLASDEHAKFRVST